MVLLVTLVRSPKVLGQLIQQIREFFKLMISHVWWTSIQSIFMTLAFCSLKCDFQCGIMDFCWSVRGARNNSTTDDNFRSTKEAFLRRSIEKASGRRSVESCSVARILCPSGLFWKSMKVIGEPKSERWKDMSRRVAETPDSCICFWLISNHFSMCTTKWQCIIKTK